MLPTPVDDQASLLDNSPVGSPTYNSSPPINNSSQSKPTCTRATLIGSMCLFLCLITWETMGELLQDVNIEYPKPAMLTFIVHSWYATLLIPLVIYHRKDLTAPINKHWTMIKLSLYLFPLMWLAAYLWYVSLRQTLVSANNAIYQSQCVFVYLCSIVIMGEKFDIRKIGVLSLCVAGVVLVVSMGATQSTHSTNTTITNITNLSPSSSFGPHKVVIEQTLWGYIALLLGVVAFAIYEVLFKLYEQKEESRKLTERIAAGRLGSAGMLSESEGQDSLEASLIFLGSCGLVNIALAWPFIPIFNAIGNEPFEWPTATLTSTIMLNGFIDTIFNFAFIWGVALTSPVFTSTGTILIIPFGILVDGFLGKGSMNFLQLCGVGLIVCGFLGLNIVEKMKKNEAKKIMVVNSSESSSSRSIRVQSNEAEDAW